jgi:hypothetical protein
VCYCPQIISENADNASLFIEYLDNTFETISQSPLKGVVLVGDFNARDMCWGFTDHTNALGHRLYDFVGEHNLQQLITEPTRGTDVSESMLDLIITDILTYFLLLVPCPPYSSYVTILLLFFQFLLNPVLF